MLCAVNRDRGRAEGHRGRKNRGEYGHGATAPVRAPPLPLGRGWKTRSRGNWRRTKSSLIPRRCQESAAWPLPALVKASERARQGKGAPAPLPWRPSGAPSMGEPPTFPVYSLEPKCRVPPRAPWSRAPDLRHLWSSALPPSPRAAHPLPSSPPLGDPPDASPERVDVAASTYLGVMAS